MFRFIGGLGIGIASISTPMYIAEITPAHLRGRMVAVNQIAIVGGLALVYFVNYGIANAGRDLAGVPEPIRRPPTDRCHPPHPRRPRSDHRHLHPALRRRR